MRARSHTPPPARSQRGLPQAGGGEASTASDTHIARRAAAGLVPAPPRCRIPSSPTIGDGAEDQATGSNVRVNNTLECASAVTARVLLSPCNKPWKFLEGVRLNDVRVPRTAPTLDPRHLPHKTNKQTKTRASGDYLLVRASRILFLVIDMKTQKWNSSTPYTQNE